MITTKFNTWDFGVWCPDETGTNRSAFRAPELTFSLAVDNVVRMLNQIELSYQQDLEGSRDVRAGGLVNSHLPEFSEWVFRELWRIGSYVVFLCSLDRLLAQQYSWLSDQWGDLTHVIRGVRESGRDEAGVSRRRHEMKDVFTYPPAPG